LSSSLNTGDKQPMATRVTPLFRSFHRPPHLRGATLHRRRPDPRIGERL